MTGHDQNGETPQTLNWSAISQGSQVLVIYMGMKHAKKIASELIKAGRSPQEPVAVVTNATTMTQNVLETTLLNLNDDIVSSKVKPPAIICVGKAVLMRQVLNWQDMLNGGLPKNIDPLGRDILTEVS